MTRLKMVDAIRLVIRVLEGIVAEMESVDSITTPEGATKIDPATFVYNDAETCRCARCKCS